MKVIVFGTTGNTGIQLVKGLLLADRVSNFIQLNTSEDTQIEHDSSNQFMQTKFQSAP